MPLPIGIARRRFGPGLGFAKQAQGQFPPTGAIRFGAGAGNDGLVSTQPVGFNAHTVWGWFRFRQSQVGLSVQMCGASLESVAPDGSGPYQLLFESTFQTNTVELHDNVNGGFLFTPTMAPMEWWFIASTNNRYANPSAGQTTFYARKMGNSAPMAAITGNTHPAATKPTRFLVGTDDAGGQNEWWDGDIAGVGVASREYSLAEIDAQSRQLYPVSTLGLHAFYPLSDTASMLLDASGKQRHLAPIVSGGSWSRIDGPQIPTGFDAFTQLSADQGPTPRARFAPYGSYGRRNFDGLEGSFRPFQQASDQLAAAGAALAGDVAAAASPTGALTTAITPTGAVAAAGTLAGALTTAIPLTGAITGGATVAGNLTTSITMAGAVSAPGVLAGSLTTAITLAGNVSAGAVAAGALTTAIPLAGAISAGATATGDLTVGANTSLAGSIAAAASLTGSLTTAIALAGSVATGATVAGALTTSITLGGAISSNASLTGSLSTSIRLAGGVSAAAATQGALTTSISLAGGLAGVASGTGALTTGIRLTGAIASSGTLTGGLLERGAISGDLSGSATLTGYLSFIEIIAITGAVEGPTAVTGAADGALALAAAAEGPVSLHSYADGVLSLVGQVE